jgi:hypothetical protein
VDNAHADRLAFGTFRSADNASNWAQKLSAAFAQPVHVNEVESGGKTLYRVASEELDEAAYGNISRRADAAGVQYWRLRTLDNSTIAVVQPQSLDLPTTVISAEPQLGGARLSPPSPVSSASRITVPNAANTTTQWDAGLQSRVFADTGDFGQDRFEASLSVELEYYRGWDNDAQSITFTPFLRVDSADSERSHGDIRELF